VSPPPYAATGDARDWHDEYVPEITERVAAHHRDVRAYSDHRQGWGAPSLAAMRGWHWIGRPGCPCKFNNYGTPPPEPTAPTPAAAADDDAPMSAAAALSSDGSPPHTLYRGDPIMTQEPDKTASPQVSRASPSP
jgi:hypothetical protein